MKFTVVNSYSKLLEENAIHVILEKGGKEFEASGLFFPWNEIGDEVILEVLHEEDLSEDADAFAIVDKVLELRENHNLPIYKDSRKTLLHWQYVNGVTNSFVGSTGDLVDLNKLVENK